MIRGRITPISPIGCASPIGPRGHCRSQSRSGKALRELPGTMTIPGPAARRAPKTRVDDTAATSS
eukprot:scaffold1206_cov388-Prasinococcus_capsulatus_cf.AAC.38